ncbi:SGNH/GDSL hydrolase family protein [Nonomuraea typhae]|uniref:SGNH/GDSL hydrolase family protein n=1 Tax=Nonomuraea typhae TaxID=2603600 RepID=UPI0012FC14A6|nr:SGNH/GDSL hydrolase family protein [Nonomuraea typhae]
MRTIFCIATLLFVLTALAPPAAAAAPYVYVALGDSVASGHGVDTSATDDCRRSTAAYPDLVYATLSNSDFHDLACSGTTTALMLSRQVGHADRMLGGDSGLVTITIGANDFEFAKAMTYVRAFLPGLYGEFRRFRDRAAERVRTNLATALERLGAGKPQRTIMVTTYFNPFNAKSVLYETANWLGAQCDWTQYGRPPCHQVMAESVEALNAAILGAVADYAGTGADARVIAVDEVAAAFDERRAPKPYCGTADPTFEESWIQARQDGRLNVFDPPRNGDDCFHPNARGQEELAGMVLRAMPGS